MGMYLFVTIHIHNVIEIISEKFYSFKISILQHYSIIITINLILHYIIKCTVINCGNLPMITSGAVDTSGGTNYKCTAVYTCNTGYVLNGNITRTCQVDGMWSGSEPTCDGM